VEVKTSGSYASAAAKAAPAEAEDLSSQTFRKIMILPPFVREVRYRDRVGKKWEYYTMFVVNGNLEKEKGIRPEFNDVSNLLLYLQKYHPDIEFVICPHSLKKGFKTMIPTLPGTLFNHLKRHHQDVLRELGIDPRTYSPVIWSHQENDYSTPALEKKKRMSKIKTRSYRKGKVTVTKSDVEAWPELGDGGSKSKKKRKPHYRKKTLQLTDRDGNEVDAISSSNAFSSLASDGESAEESD